MILIINMIIVFGNLFYFETIVLNPDNRNKSIYKHLVRFQKNAFLEMTLDLKISMLMSNENTYKKTEIKHNN